MSISDKISQFLSLSGASIASFVKIIVQSRRCSVVDKALPDEELVILGNGPSLKTTISDSRTFLDSRKLLAVNFAANTDEFLDLKPEYYVLADMHFFNGIEHENVAKLWSVISNRVDWDMVLFVPSSVKNRLPFTGNSHVKLKYYNLTPIEGFRLIEDWAFSTGLGMPRPRNVLIPSIMIALKMRYPIVYIAGADHSWLKTISVDDNNRVVSIQPHFYKENEKELKRINTEYMNYPLHQILYSFYVAFKSYFTIARYARKIGVKVYNITPESYIDAFERKKI